MKKYIRGYLRRYGGHSAAYSSMQEGMEHFVVPGAGYIPYCLSGSTRPIAVVLSNPVCAPADYERLTGDFLKRFPRAAFVQVTAGAARVLEGMGFYVNEMGVETEIDVQEYDFGGRAKEAARRIIRRAKEAGVTVSELKGVGAFKDELMEVSRQWLGTKTINDRELRFVARRAVYEAEPDVRKFISRLDGRITGFIFFDPMYRDGRVYGYCADILRTGREAHPGTLTLIMKTAMERFRDEGAEVLSLGLSPFFDIDDSRFRHSRFMKHAFRFLYKTDGAIYPFKDLCFTKSRYGGGVKDGAYRDGNVRKKKVYFAHQSRFPVHEIYHASMVSGAIEGVLPAVKKFLFHATARRALKGRAFLAPLHPQKGF